MHQKLKRQLTNAPTRQYAKTQQARNQQANAPICHPNHPTPNDQHPNHPTTNTPNAMSQQPNNPTPQQPNSLLPHLPAPPPGKTGWPWTEETDPGIYDIEVEWPKISIVTPSYNQGGFIEETIRSILLQNYPNLEFIIMDGGSTDETVEILKKYDPWITHWESKRDRGQSDAINNGFERAKGEIFSWLNTDDFFLPKALFTVAQTYLNNSDEYIEAWVGAADKITADGKLIYTSLPKELTLESFYHWRNPERPANQGNFLQPACFFTKRAWEKAGPLDLDLEYCMDVALWLRMARNFKFAPIHEKLAIAVGHSEAKTTKEVEKTIAEVALVVAEYGGRDVAKIDLMRMVDQYLELKEKWNKLSNFPLIRLWKPLLRRILRPKK